VAVLSRGPSEKLQEGLPGQEGMGSRLLAVRYHGITFTTVYCPNGKSVDHEDYGKKVAWFDSLVDYVGQRLDPSQPTVLTGDFNIVPAPLDSWNDKAFAGQIHHTEAERARVSALLDWGFFDLYREKHPAEQGFTWWDYRAGSFHKKQGLRIDLMLATATVKARLQDATVERDWRKKVDGLISSDHAPLWIDLAD